MVERKGIDLNKAEERLKGFLNNHKHPIFESIHAVDEDGNRIPQDEAFEITDTFHPLSHFILFPRHPAHADIEVMRKIARHLCDLVLIPHNSVVSRDHSLYWTFTRNMLLRCSQEKDNFSIFQEGRSGPVGDFHTMVEIASLPWRLESVNEGLAEELQNSNLFQYNLEHINVLSQLGPSSLALLEGFVSDPTVFDSDGWLKTETKKRPWRPDPLPGVPWNYHDKILYWKEYDSNETTRKTLEKINDLTRYNNEWLKNKAGIGGRDEIGIEDGSTENYLHVLTGQRNYTIHGHGSGFSITPVAINLLCLYIWDNMPSEIYDEVVNNISGGLGDWDDEKLDD
ncbi:hypothetical protein [Halorubrum sp. AS12]|uniref:hypothetical protein n=1 Tax=Halorubrum sp. AS12 TaxID=3409687 RepID=UPI003DA76E4A